VAERGKAMVLDPAERAQPNKSGQPIDLGQQV
jgi:hypothetical protein